MDDQYQYRAREVEPEPDKEFVIGNGRISGYLSLFLGGLSLLAVLAYLFPSYLTTTELRAAYNAEFLQHVLKYPYSSTCKLELYEVLTGRLEY